MQNVDINVRYLPNDIIQRGMVNIVCSPVGTGKTTMYVNHLLQNPDSSVMSFVFRRSLGQFLEAQLPDMKSYTDQARFPPGKKINPLENPRIIISPESLSRYGMDNSSGAGFPVPRELFIDEICSLFEHIVNKSTIDGHRRSRFIQKLKLLFNSPMTTVVCCDAYIQDSDMDIIKLLCEDHSRIRFIKNRFTQASKKIILYNDPTVWKTAYYYHAMNKEKKIFLFSNCKSTLRGLDQGYHKMQYPGADPLSSSQNLIDDRRIIICSDSSNEDKEQYSSQPDDTWSLNRILSISPTVQAGVSFMKEHFDVAFGFAIPRSGSVLSFLQQMGRVRNLRENTIHLYLPKDFDTRKIPTNFLDDEISSAIVRQNFSRYANFVDRCMRDLADANLFIDSDGWLVENFQMQNSILNEILIRYIVNRAKQKLSFRSVFTEYIANDWYTVEPNDPFFDYGVDYTENIMVTNRVDAKEFAEKFWKSETWDGEWEHSLAIRDHGNGNEESVGGRIGKFAEFAEKWNIFGALGPLSKLERPVLNKDRLAELEPTIFVRESQYRFEELFLHDWTKRMKLDFSENRPYQQDYRNKCVTFNAISLLFHAYRLFPAISDQIIIPGQLNFRDSNFWQTVADVPKEFIVMENFLNTKSVFESLCKALNRDYAIVANELNWRGLHQVKPVWLTTRVFSTKAKSEMMAMLDAALKYVGLKREFSKHPDVPAFKPNLYTCGEDETRKKMRINLQTYRILNCKERIMLLMCRLFKRGVPGGVEHPNYVAPDPFNLLVWDRVPRKVLESLAPLARNEVRILRRSTIPITEERQLEIDLDSCYGNYHFWPIKQLYMCKDWITQMKSSWGKIPNQIRNLTTLENVLDRFDYWNPRVTPTLHHQPLPPAFTSAQLQFESISTSVPFRLLDSNPHKRQRVFEIIDLAAEEEEIAHADAITAELLNTLNAESDNEEEE